MITKSKTASFFENLFRFFGGFFVLMKYWLNLINQHVATNQRIDRWSTDEKNREAELCAQLLFSYLGYNSGKSDCEAYESSLIVQMINQKERERSEKADVLISFGISLWI